MKSFNPTIDPIDFRKIGINFPVYLFTLIFILFATVAFSQKQKDIELFVDCIEYIGNNKYQVNFGYDNPNKDEINVHQDYSIVKKNNGNAFGHTNFKKGRQYKVFSAEFDYTDRVEWAVLMPGGDPEILDDWKITTASSNSSHCSGDDNLIPLFDGKNEGGVIWPELYWLAQQTDQPESNEIFQIDNSNEKVLIEVIAFEGMDLITLRAELIKRGLIVPVPNTKVIEMKQWGKKKKGAYISHIKAGKTKEEAYELVCNFGRK